MDIRDTPKYDAEGNRVPKPSVGKPQGPYTVWVDTGAGWAPTDFDSLQAALEWEGKGSHRFVITKPVQYVVQEVGATPASFRPVKNGGPAAAEEMVAFDPDNPDSGQARYV